MPGQATWVAVERTAVASRPLRRFALVISGRFCYADRHLTAVLCGPSHYAVHVVCLSVHPDGLVYLQRRVPGPAAPAVAGRRTLEEALAQVIGVQQKFSEEYFCNGNSFGCPM